MEHFFTVAQQVVVLFLLIGAGYVLAKKGIMTDAGAKVCSDIVLMLVTPCVIVRSFAGNVQVQALPAALGASVLLHVVGIGIAHLVYRGDGSRDRVMRLGTVLSNAGFMGLPLQQAVLGNIGTFYCTAYIVVFNLVQWSYGSWCMCQNGGKLPIKKMLLNPGMVGLLMGVAVLLMPWELPGVIAAPMNHLANLNTPLPMLFIGHYLYKAQLGKVLRTLRYYGAAALRLLVVPIVGLALLYLLGIRGELLVSMAIAAIAPTAAATAMFAARFEQDTETAVNMVALSTVLSLISMPVLVALVQAIA